MGWVRGRLLGSVVGLSALMALGCGFGSSVDDCVSLAESRASDESSPESFSKLVEKNTERCQESDACAAAIVKAFDGCDDLKMQFACAHTEAQMAGACDM